MNKKVALSVLSATVFASMAASAFAAPKSGLYIGGNVDKYYSMDTLFKMNSATADQFSNELVQAGFSNLIYVDFDGKGASISEIMAAPDFDKAKQDLKASKFEGTYANITADGTANGTYDPRPDAIGDDSGDLKVDSVSAINSTQLVVKFTTAVKEASVVDSGTLTNGVFTINGLTTDGVAANAVGAADGLKASLSADGKTLTIDADTYFDGRYEFQIAADKVETADGKKLDSYSTVVTAKDTVKPTLVNVTYPNNKTARVNFSEPLSTEGSVTAVYANGTSANVPASLTPGNSYVDLDLTNVTANQNVTVTIVGAKDKKGNLSSPNPLTVTVKKDTSDATAPTVASVTPVSPTAFDIKLSEAARKAVAGDLAAGTVGAIKVGSTDVTANAAFDSADASVIHVTGITAVTGLQTITVEAQAVVDTSGNLNAAFTKVVNFDIDAVKPTVASASIETISNVKYLVVNYSENVTPVNGKALVFNYVNANGEALSTTITTKAAAGAGQVSLHNPVNGASKSIKIDVSTLIAEDYTVDLLAGLVQDSFANDSELKAGVAVTVGASNQQAILKDKDGVGNNDDDNGVEVISNDKLRVNFAQQLDIASATTASNYSVEGATVKTAKIFKNNGTDGYIVELTLAADSVKLDGDYEVSVSNVKSNNGTAMNAYATQESLTENVTPKVTNVQVTDITQDDAATAGVNEAATEVTLTFSEDVAVGAGNAVDFDLYIKGTKVTASGVTVGTAAGASATKVVVTITGKALSAQDFADGVQLKGQTDAAGAPTIDIKDLNNNLIDITNPISVSL